MASETGHSNNVANMEDLIAFCTAYGTDYNPSKETLKIDALNALFTNAKDSIRSVTAAKNEYNIAIGERQDAFRSLKTLSTKIVTALSVTDATDSRVQDARTINNKIQGRRSSPRPKAPAKDATTPPAENTISTAQQSYDSLLDHFHKLVELVSSEPNYAPNETGLKVTALAGRLTDMRAANSNLINKFTGYSNAMIARDKVLYASGNGLIDIVLDVKQYVKSVYGSTSPQFKQVHGVRFKRRD